MGATASDLQKAIQPDSTQSGDRKTLEAGLSQVMGGGGGTAPVSPSAPPPVDSANGNPLAAMLDGSLDPGSSEKLTDGLSVGPGITPGAERMDPVKTRLLDVAKNSRSPLVRQTARNELRRRTRGLL